jgi:hypothetical protein
MILVPAVLFFVGALVCAGLAWAVWRRAPGQPSALGLGLGTASYGLGLLAAGPLLAAGGAALHVGALIVGILGVQRAVRIFQPATLDAPPPAGLLSRLLRTGSALALFFVMWMWPMQEATDFGRDQRDAAAAEAGLQRVGGAAILEQPAGAVLELVGVTCAAHPRVAVRVYDGERAPARFWLPLRLGASEPVPALVTGDCGTPLRVEVMGPLHLADRQEAARAELRLAEGAVGLRALRVSSVEALVESGLVALVELGLRALVVGWIFASRLQLPTVVGRPAR